MHENDCRKTVEKGRVLCAGLTDPGVMTSQGKYRAKAAREKGTVKTLARMRPPVRRQEVLTRCKMVAECIVAQSRKGRRKERLDLRKERMTCWRNGMDTQ